jgi:hypothetical protein
MVRALRLATATTTTIYKKHIIIRTIHKDKKLLFVKDPQQRYWVIITKHNVVQFIANSKFKKSMLSVLNLLEEKWTIRAVISNDKPGHPFAHPLNEIKTYFPFGPKEPPIESIKDLLTILDV